MCCLAALWGGSFLFMRIAAPQFGPVSMIELRVAMAALFLLPILYSKHGFTEMKQYWRRLLLIGILNTAIPFCLFAFATLSLTAGFAAILNATAPFFGALVAYVWFQERFTRLRVLGLLIGFIGVLILLWGKTSFKPGGAGPAVVAALGATFLYGFCANMIKKMATGLHSLTIATGSQIGAALFLLPAALWLWPQETPRTSGWISVVLLALACTSLAYVLFFRLISSVGPTKTIAVTFLIPLFGMLWGVIFLNETVTWIMVVGCGIILLGTALTTGIIRARL